MKFTLSTLLLLAFPLLSSAQEKASATTVGLAFSPDYTYRTLKSDVASLWIADTRDAREKAVFGFNAGVVFSHRFKAGLTLELGALYSRVGEKIENEQLVAFEPPQNTLISNDNKIVNHYDYISIPGKIGYSYGLNEKIRFSINSGISANVFVTRHFKSRINYVDGSGQTTSSTYNSESPGFERINFSTVSSIGIEYKFSKSLIARFEPTFRYSLTSIIDAPIRQYPYSFGLNCGVHYILGSLKNS